MKSKKTREPMRPRIREEHREGLRAAAYKRDTKVATIVNDAVALHLLGAPALGENLAAKVLAAAEMDGVPAREWIDTAVALYLRIDARVGLDRVRKAAEGDGLTIPDFVSGALSTALTEADLDDRQMAKARHRPGWPEHPGDSRTVEPLPDLDEVGR